MIRELFDSGTTQRPQLDSVEITSQTPTYLQGQAIKMAASTIEDIVAVLVTPTGGGVKLSAVS